MWWTIESFLLNGLGKALQTDSTDVMTVETGNSALQEIDASPYQLCFLDLFLPDVNGMDVLKKIKEISPKTKVIMMTAGVVTRNMQESIEKDLLVSKLLAKGTQEKGLTKEAWISELNKRAKVEVFAKKRSCTAIKGREFYRRSAAQLTPCRFPVEERRFLPVNGV